uniref:Lipoprotein n=1 Tax=Geobacter metallireducens TaxID=28232 RepID=A0A831UEG7_GEOME
MFNQNLRKLALPVCLMYLSGCASIVSKSSWPVNVQSNPSGAKCVVSKEGGFPLHTGETPMTITLDSSSGFFQTAKYTITCNKEGYEKSSSQISSHLNGWYLGNIVFGGLIGLLIVDPATGAMYKLDDTFVVNMAKVDTPKVDGPSNVSMKVDDTKAVNQAPQDKL